jgi:glucoamylase
LIATQKPDGSWSQNGFPNGRPFWTGIQLDEVGFPILLAAKLAERGSGEDVLGLSDMIGRAAAYIARSGPISPQDRWEENAGISPFTIGIEIVALIAAAERLEGEDRTYALSLADYWNERIEDWTYCQSDTAKEKFGVGGYYVRLAPPSLDRGFRGRIDVAERKEDDPSPAALVGMEYLYLPRLALRDPQDPAILNTLKVTEAILKVETPSGVAYRRYDQDAYGEYDDGRPFDGNGVGRAWPLLAGERGHFDVLLGKDPLPYLDAMARMTGPCGLIPEQVWDAPAIPERELHPGKPSGSVMPLVWAHAEFLKLLAARKEGRALETLDCVERRYARKRPDAKTWHWRLSAPFDVLPPNRSLVIESRVPFRLHFGFDGWEEVGELRSSAIGLSMHGVRFRAEELSVHRTIDFTSYFVDEDRWEGVDHHISLNLPDRQRAD